MEILNFRGIKQLEWEIPDQQVICLIGKGDSAKTTILEAIRCAFSPQWNRPFNDSDFHLCNTDQPIRIEVVIGELPDEFCSEQKYGAHLRGWDKAGPALHDEPEDADEVVLSARLTVAKELEPKWKYCHHTKSRGCRLSIYRPREGQCRPNWFLQREATDLGRKGPRWRKSPSLNIRMNPAADSCCKPAGVSHLKFAIKTLANPAACAHPNPATI